MVDLVEMAPSPQQLLNEQGVLRITGFRRYKTGNNFNSQKKLKVSYLRIATINIATARGKEEEMIEVMKSRRLDVLGLAETRLKGNGDQIIHGNCKMIYSGNDDGRHGVGIILSPKLACRVSGVQ